MQTRDAHAHIQCGITETGHADDRRSGGRQGRDGQRDMPFPGKQARSRIHADPTGAGNVGFAPGMQIGEIGRGSGRPLQRLFISHQLDQVAGHKTGGNPKVSQQLHQKPGAVTTGTGMLRQRFLAGLDTRLQANQVGDGLLDFLVDQYQQIGSGDTNRDSLAKVRQPGLKQRAKRLGCQERGQFRGHLLGIAERVMLSPFLDKKIEGVDDRHVGQ